jgi:hypothetical protein
MMVRDFLQLIAQTRSNHELGARVSDFWRLNSKNAFSDADVSDLLDAVDTRRAEFQAVQSQKPTPIAAPMRVPKGTLATSSPAPTKLEEHPKRQKKSEGFFAVDLGAFRCAAIGGLNPAVAHLVMARGTGRDNSKTQWSVNLIEQRTGISRPNAARAVQNLLDRGVWKKARGGKHPVYEAVPGNQIPGGPFTTDEQAAISAIRGRSAMPDELDAAAKALAARGIAKATATSRPHSRQAFELDEAALAALTSPRAVWLPNALIDGAANEVPPVELLRQTRSLPALRLLIELYAVQYLPHHGGVPRELLQMKFDRAKIGQQGPFVVWGFKPENWSADHELARQFFTGKLKLVGDRHREAAWDDFFWPAVHTLVELGLVERVGMLLDGNDAQAEIIHSYAIHGGEPAERELACSACYAAQGMVTEAQLNWSEKQGFEHLVPVRKHIGEASIVEIARLKYRPHTSATAAWYAMMQNSTAEYLDHYRALITNSAAAIAAA